MFGTPRLLQPGQIKPGDIVGFAGNEWLSAFISVVTYGLPWWSLSHVGIVGQHEGKNLLFESTTLEDVPCAVRGVMFSGTQAVDLDHRIKTYNGKVWHYPLVRSLYQNELERLNTYLHETVGIPYDAVGAFRSGGVGYSWLEGQLREADLSSIFCSEWCCAAHTEIGLFRTDNVSRFSPSKFVRAERRQGILNRPRRLK
jgi:hypothetical protein